MAWGAVAVGVSGIVGGYMASQSASKNRELADAQARDAKKERKKQQEL